MNSYSQLCEVYKKIDILRSVTEILGWDQSVMMPLKGGELRGMQLETISEIIHKNFTGKEFTDLLNNINESDLSRTDVINLKLMKKAQEHISCLDEKLYVKFTSMCSQTELNWRKAKKNQDFSLIKNDLSELVKLSREIAKIKSARFNCTPYEALADEFDPNIKEIELDVLFRDLKEKLSDILPGIMEKNSCNQKIENLLISPEKQKSFFLSLMEKMGFDFSAGRLDESEHPFCSGSQGDIRITTKYKDDNFIDSMLAVIHETGHAFYEYNLPKEFNNLPIGKACGMAVHESQSLFYENHIGMSEEFLSFLYPEILKKFQLTSNDLCKKKLVNSLRIVKPSLIRIEADEVTYPMHIILRYEIEKALIDGDIQVNDLPAIWNEKMKQMLGIDVPNDSLGCMQDIHWYSGSFGYFPSYLLGSLIASQLKEKMSETINITEQLIKGELEPINSWLKNNIHNSASAQNRDQLILSVTGKKLDYNPFINHIKHRYS